MQTEQTQAENLSFFVTENQAPVSEAAPQEAEQTEASKQDETKTYEEIAKIARLKAAARKQAMAVKEPLKQKESELSKLQEELSRLKKYEEINDPIELLKAKGWDYEDIIAKQLNPEGFDTKKEMESLREEIQRLREENETKEKTYLEKQREETLKGYVRHIENFTKGNESYELINMNNAHQDVVDLMQETYNKSGKILSEEEACQMVENYFEEQMAQILDTLKKSNKIKSKFNLFTDEKPVTNEIPDKTNFTIPAQLSPQEPVKETSRLTDEERLARAAALLKWNNN